MCARALGQWPNSGLVWYLNLQVFRPLRYGIALLPRDGLAQSTWVAAPLIALVCIGLLLKNRLPLAIAAHLSLLYSALLFCSGATSTLASTLALAAGSQGWQDPNLLAMAIVLLSLLSCMISHREYWR